MNTILYIGLTFIIVGFLLFILSEIMTRYYDRKLWKLRNKFEYIKVKPKIKNGK
mgnify:CR=1 FL=1